MATISKTVTLIPSGYTGLTGMTINSSYPITRGYTDANSTNYTRFDVTQSTTGSVYFTFNVSDIIPSNATVTSVTARGKARVSNTTRVSSTVMQLYTNTTAKGSNRTFASTTASTQTITAGSWTRSELSNLRLKIGGTASSSSSSRRIDFYGADVTVTYTIPAYDISVTNSTSATVTASPTPVQEGESSTITSDTISGISITDNGTDITSQFTSHSGTTGNYTITNRGSYGFALSNGYYVSQNKGVDKSAAVCRINFSLPVTSTVTITYINYAEANYDFGVFGNIDTELSTSYYAASSSSATITDSSYKKACNTSADNTSTAQTLTYSNVSAGDHYIDVKFSKDDGSSANNDTLQFQVAITYNQSVTYYSYTISNISADHTIVVSQAAQKKMYVKVNGSWVEATAVYKKVNGSWVQQTDLSNVFESGVNYLKS